MDGEQYLEINKQLWNERTGIHYTSAFYNVAEFLHTKNSLNPIELELIGDIKGRSVLHLQCHFGMDTLRLAHLGAHVTGIDLSDEAISKANVLKEQTQLGAEFICCNVYDVPQHINQTFDLVFTSYGTIGWLPDLERWASVVNKMLKPGGSFLLVEFHPVLWMFDADIKNIAYAYFNNGRIIEEEKGTYANRDATMENIKSITWNHGLSEVMSALMHAGLKIELFREYDYSPYNIFSNGVETAKGKFHVEGLEGKLPLVYALKAVKPQ